MATAPSFQHRPDVTLISHHLHVCPECRRWGSLSAHYCRDRRWQPEGPQGSSESPELSTIAQATDVAPVSDFAKGSSNCSRIPRNAIAWVEVGTCLRVLSKTPAGAVTWGGDPRRCWQGQGK